MDAAAGPLVRARHDLLRGRPDLALAVLGNVSGAELGSPDFWRVRALATYQLGRFEEAVQAAEQGLERAPNDIQLLDVLALANSERRRKKDALRVIDAAIDLRPEDPILHAHKAVILTRNAANAIGFASYRKARAAAEAALRIDPGCPIALKARAQVAVLSGERRARAFAAGALSAEPGDDFAHALYGNALTNRGHVTKGREHYAEAARLDPQSPDAARLLRTTKPFSHIGALPLRLYWRLGPLPVMLTLLVLVLGFLWLYLATGIGAPLAVVGILFIPFYWYLVVAGAIARGSRRR
jgi:tetratricopeptide (TPR) repeat protein